MKKTLIAIVALVSLTVQANVCELNAEFDAFDNKVVLSLIDKDNARNDSLSSNLNPKNLDCESLIAEIRKSGKKTVTMQGAEIPLQLVYTINL